MQKNVRVTVLRKLFLADLANAYLTDGVQAGNCPFFNEGDVFIYTGDAVMPERFCPWAWIDIYRTVSAISTGSSYTPWSNKENTSVICCSDGIRPVVFLIEAVE